MQEFCPRFFFWHEQRHTQTNASMWDSQTGDASRSLFFRGVIESLAKYKIGGFIRQETQSAVNVGKKWNLIPSFNFLFVYFSQDTSVVCDR